MSSINQGTVPRSTALPANQSGNRPLIDLHVHTDFCDGKATAEEMVLAAIEKGMTAIGFSGHSHTAFDEGWCMSAEGTEQYKKEIARLKEKYAGKIDILCGVEQDLFSEASVAGYDYVIGSVHYLLPQGDTFTVDYSKERLLSIADEYFNGDLYAVAEKYYENVSLLWEKTHCDIVGHFDLITKFNEGGCLFDENHPRYVAAWKKAAERLLQNPVLFELNTGAVFRGYRTVPYPAEPIRRYLQNRGARLILSGDSHCPEALCFKFDRYAEEITK